MTRSVYPLLLRLHARLISLPLTVMVLVSFVDDFLRFYRAGLPAGAETVTAQFLAMKYTVLFVMVWMVRRSVHRWQNAEATIGTDGLSFTYRGHVLWNAKWKSIRSATLVNKPLLKVLPRLSLQVELNNRKTLTLPLSPMSIPMPHLDKFVEELKGRGVKLG